MVTWDIRRDGRAWGGEAISRYQMTPEKTEMVAGNLYGTAEERLTMLARSSMHDFRSQKLAALTTSRMTET